MLSVALAAATVGAFSVLVKFSAKIMIIREIGKCPADVAGPGVS